MSTHCFESGSYQYIVSVSQPTARPVVFMPRWTGSWKRFSDAGLISTSQIMTVESTVVIVTVPVPRKASGGTERKKRPHCILPPRRPLIVAVAV